MTGVHRRRQLTAGLLAAFLAAATDWLYLALVHDGAIVPFVTTDIAVIAVLACVGVGAILVGRPAVAKTVFLATAAGSWALGLIGLASIGVLLVITAVLLAIAAWTLPPIGRPNAWLWPVSGAAVAIVAVIAGFVVAGTL
jgi:hypothetical protein